MVFSLKCHFLSSVSVAHGRTVSESSGVTWERGSGGIKNTWKIVNISKRKIKYNKCLYNIMNEKCHIGADLLLCGRSVADLKT